MSSFTDPDDPDRREMIGKYGVWLNSGGILCHPNGLELVLAGGYPTLDNKPYVTYDILPNGHWVDEYGQVIHEGEPPTEPRHKRPKYFGLLDEDEPADPHPMPVTLSDLRSLDNKSIIARCARFGAFGITPARAAKLLGMQTGEFEAMYGAFMEMGQTLAIEAVGAECLNRALYGDRELMRLFLKARSGGEWDERNRLDLNVKHMLDPLAVEQSARAKLAALINGEKPEPKGKG